MRVLQGVGGGLFSPQVTGMIQQYFQGHSRARAFGFMGLVVSASVAVGPLLSGSLVSWLGQDPGWRYSFFINVPLGALGLLAAWKLLPFGKERRTIGPHHEQVEQEFEQQELAEGKPLPPRRKEKVDLDPIGMLLLMIAVLGIMSPFMMHGVTWRWYLLAGGFAMIGVWIAWELGYARAGHVPAVNMKMFRIRSFSYSTAISALQFLGSSTIFVVLALFLQDGLGETALLVGIIGFPNAVASGFASVWAGRKALEHGKAIQVLALSLMLGSVLLLVGGFVTSLGWSAYWLALPVIPMGVGAGLMGSANQTQSMMDVPPAHGGTAGGLQQMTQRITTAIGNALVTGVMFSTYQGGRTAQGWLVGASVGLGAIAVFLAAALALAVIFWKWIPSAPSE